MPERERRAHTRERYDKTDSGLNYVERLTHCCGGGPSNGRPGDPRTRSRRCGHRDEFQGLCRGRFGFHSNLQRD